MKIKQIYCPNCGGSIKGDLSSDSVYCPYCGTRLFIDHERKEVTINQNININKKEETHRHYYDEAKIAEHKKAMVSDLSVVALIVFIFLLFYFL